MLLEKLLSGVIQLDLGLKTNDGEYVRVRINTANHIAERKRGIPI